MNLRYTDSDALRIMAHILDILHANNDYFLRMFHIFHDMTDDEFDYFVSSVTGNCMNMNADLNNAALMDYIIRAEIDAWERYHNKPVTTTIVVDGTDRNTGEVMYTKELLIDSSDERRTCMRIKGLLLGFRNKDYDIHVHMSHN
jgi:hypothetical protein